MGATSAEAYAARARALRPLLEKNAAETNRLRHVHPENVAAMKHAGFWEIARPARIGGAQLPLRALHRVTAELAQACPSSAWVLSVTSAHVWLLGLFSDAVQDEIAADDPDTVVSGTLAAQGVARPAPGGWRVSGRWQFASGCDHARWNMIGARVESDDAAAPKGVHVMAPTADYAIDDTWHVLGLRGTGSKDLVLDDVFVPAHRALPTSQLFLANGPDPGRHGSVLYWTPVSPGLAFHICGPVLGIAKGALAAHVAATRVRADKYTGAQKAHSPGQHFRVAEADMAIRAAEALMEQVADAFDDCGARRALPDAARAAEITLLAAQAVKLCRDAVQRLYDGAGSNAAREGTPLAGFFRDMSVGSHHGIVDFDAAAEAWGRVLLGLKPGR
jgi:3-hydroxy-9,10-secoandrosta-1,3,5(10)-triene-9,17-dione monooxygenase